MKFLRSHTKRQSSKKGERKRSEVKTREVIIHVLFKDKENNSRSIYFSYFLQRIEAMNNLFIFHKKT